MCAEVAERHGIKTGEELLRLDRRWILHVLQRPRDKEGNLIVSMKEFPQDRFISYWRKMGMADWQIALLRRQLRIDDVKTAPAGLQHHP